MPTVYTTIHRRTGLYTLICLLLGIIAPSAGAHDTVLPENEEVSHFRQQLMHSIENDNCLEILTIIDELEFHRQPMDDRLNYFKGKCQIETGSIKAGISSLNEYINSSDSDDIYAQAARELLKDANYNLTPGLLTLKTEPAGAKIRFLNTDLTYVDGIKLTPGDYLIEVSLAGHLTERRWLNIEPGRHQFDWPLTPHPQMVRIEAGCIAAKQSKATDEFCLPEFEIGRYELTNAEWDAVMGRRFPPCKDDRQPISNKSWGDVQLFIERLNFITGHNYRLPTEAEWMYAASAGKAKDYHWGDEIGHNLANCNGCGSSWDNQSHSPVGSFEANPWGIHDMHGNMYEWTCSNYDEQPNYSNICDLGPLNSAGKIIKGGAWNTHHKRLRTTDRVRYSAEVDTSNIGLRLVKELETASGDVVTQSP